MLHYKWDKPTDKGNYVYDKVSWIDYNKDFDWYICSSAYIAEINSTAGRLKKYLWLTSFIMLLMVLCIGAVYFKRLLKPIEILSLQAARVQEGKLSVRNRIRGSSEIGTLAQTFDNMLDTIQDNINFLDKKVSERTRDLQETVKKLDFLASYDPMTGIYNRRKFFELAASRFDEDRDDLYAAMMDIDKFKKINDTYGHAIGDLMLSAVAATIKKQLKEDALFGRLGGEEFAIISHYASWREMETHIEQIRESIEKMEIQTENGDIIRCTISTGVAKKEHTLKDLDEFLNRADEFMYRAKGMGRNRTIFRVSDHYSMSGIFELKTISLYTGYRFKVSNPSWTACKGVSRAAEKNLPVFQTPVLQTAFPENIDPGIFQPFILISGFNPFRDNIDA
ncbi:MAG: diguanylate cyclase [Desulfobacterales bacterium]